MQEQAEEVEVVAPVVAPKVEKVRGVSFKENWSAIVVDETKVPREYLGQYNGSESYRKSD